MLTPQLTIHHQQLIDHCVPLPIIDNANLDQGDTSSARLAQLLIIPPAANVTGTESELYLITALFNSVSSSSDLTNSQDSCSVYARWTVEQSKPVLHESFKALKPISDKQTAFDVRLYHHWPETRLTIPSSCHPSQDKQTSTSRRRSSPPPQCTSIPCLLSQPPMVLLTFDIETRWNLSLQMAMRSMLSLIHI